MRVVYYRVNHLYFPLLIFTRLARIVETSNHSLSFIKILDIDLDWTYWNESGRLTVSTLGISIQYSIVHIKLERVTKWGSLKLFPLEVIDVRLGRSKNQFIHINITFHFQWTRIIISSFKCSTTKFEGIQMWKIY